MNKKELSITEKVKSFEDACNLLGLESANLPVVDILPEKDQKSIIAFYKLTIIIRALNETWEPSWNNWGEYKYHNWFYAEEDGDIRSSGFRVRSADWTDAGTAVGSRLCLKEDRLAEFVGKEFDGLWDDYYKGR